MGKGYAEGPAVEAAEEERERRRAGVGKPPAVTRRKAIFGSTKRKPESHFLGWADEVDADELFQSGKAFGLRTIAIDPRSV